MSGNSDDDSNTSKSQKPDGIQQMSSHALNALHVTESRRYGFGGNQHKRDSWGHKIDKRELCFRMKTGRLATKKENKS